MLGSAYQIEFEAKRVAATQLRSLRTTASRGAREMLLLSKRKNVQQIRKEWDEETGKNLAARVRLATSATDAQVLELAKQLNQAMCRVWPMAKTQSTYFLLFKKMDVSPWVLEPYGCFSLLKDLLSSPCGGN